MELSRPSFVQKIRPRALESWDRNLGAYNRAKVQGLQCARHLSGLIGRPDLAISMERRIRDIQAPSLAGPSAEGRILSVLERFQDFVAQKTGVTQSNDWWACSATPEHLTDIKDALSSNLRVYDELFEAIHIVKDYILAVENKGSGKLKTADTSFDIVGMLSEMVKTHGEQAAILFSVENSAETITANREFMAHAFRSFISSAVAAAKAGTNPKAPVKISLSRKEHGIEITIADTGHRSRPLTIEGLEEMPFESGIESSLLLDDLRLKLALVYIKAHGGTCEISSRIEEAEKGADHSSASATTVTIRLPLNS